MGVVAPSPQPKSRIARGDSLISIKTAFEPCHAALGEIFSALAGGRDGRRERLLVRGGVLVKQVSRILHRRAIPRTLRKKLERTIWNPRVKNTTPGITMRMVFSGSSGPK